ncbi:hypothetical protein HOD29_04800 [archaeon]|jgi:hypothetical protein|nr:hypothetical protein [archaeon]
MKKLTTLLAIPLLAVSLSCPIYKKPETPKDPFENAKEIRMESTFLGCGYFGLSHKVYGKGEGLLDIANSLPKNANELLQAPVELDVYSVAGDDTIKTQVTYPNSYQPQDHNTYVYRQDAPKIIALQDLEKGDKISTVKTLELGKNKKELYQNEIGIAGKITYTKKGQNTPSQIKILK